MNGQVREWETAEIQARYDSPKARMFPGAVMPLVPERIARGGDDGGGRSASR
jgi:hypothetical protein